MNTTEEEEWLKAQGISMSADLDLITAAKQQLLFLASVDRYRCLYDGPALQRAIYRYEQCWLPLLAEHTLWDNAKFRLVVPLDCEWIWHCHRLNPVQYGKDCNKIYGRILDASFVESSRSREPDRKETEIIWKYFYPEEPYDLDLSHSVAGKSAGIIFRSMLKIQYDLTEAVRRQSSFFHQVSRPYMFDDRFLRGAEERYKGFLYLIKKNKENSVNCFCVPTYDIDLMWHSHQLQPSAYTRDMLNLLGKVLDHDDMDSDRSKGQKLDVGFTETKRQWESTFGRRYWRAGAMHRGDAPSPVPLAPLLSENCDREDFDGDNSYCLGQPLFHSNTDQFQTYQTPVKMVEVLLEVVGIKNIPKDHKGTMFVRFYRDNCPGMEAKNVQKNSESRSKPIASFQCTATGNFIFELRSRSSRTAKKGSKVLGQVSIPMQALLDSTTLSIENWFPLLRNGQRPVGSEPMNLRIAVSITPPTSSSYLLWSIRSKKFERKFQLLELILGIKRSKTVTRFYDHDDKEVFTVKTRKTAKPYSGSIVRSGEATVQGLPDKRRIVTVYQRNPNSKQSRSSGETVATAEELVTVGGTTQWALMNNSCNLLITNLNTITEEPIFELSGNLGSPLKLLSGRTLQYGVPFSNPEIEHEFVTLIRYTPEASFGEATALFNWNSGVVEVTEQESVLLVALLAEVISASLTKHHQKRLKYSSAIDAEANKKVFPRGREASDGTRVNGSGTLIKSRSNRRRGRYGQGCWGGRSGAKANTNNETKPTKAEKTLLLGLTAATLATNPGGGCGGGCASVCGGNCGG